MAIALWRLLLYQMWWWTDGYRGTQQIPGGSQISLPLTPPCLALSDSWFCWQPQVTLQQRQGVQGKDPTPQGALGSWVSESRDSTAEVKQGNEMNSEASLLIVLLASNTLARRLWWFPLNRKIGHPQIIQFEPPEKSILIFLLDYFQYVFFWGLWLFFLFSEKLVKCSVERMLAKRFLKI